MKQFERFIGEDGGAMSKLLDSQAEEFTELVTQPLRARPQHRRAAPGEGAGGEVAERLPPGPAAPVLRPGRAQPAGRLQGIGGARGEALGRRAGAADREDRPPRGRGEAAARRARGRGSSWPRSASAAPARAASSSSTPSTWSSRWPPARGDVAHHVGDERSASGGKKGDIVIEIDAASGAAEGPHRDRREGRAAVEERRLGRPERRARGARRRLRDPARRLRREGAVRAPAAARVRGQQDDRRARQGDHGPGRPGACLPLRAVPLPDGGGARPRARRGGRPRRSRGGAVGPEGRAEDPQLADRRQQGRRRRARARSTRWSCGSRPRWPASRS